MIFLALTFVFIFILSAFFSGAEMAFVSADKVRLRKLADGGDSAARAVMAFYDKPQRFLISILIGNNITQVAATALLSYVFIECWTIENQWLVTVIMAPLMIVFGEMVPKDFCRVKADQFLIKSVLWLKLFFAIFYFPAEFFLRSVHFFLPPTSTGSRKSIFVNEEEFRSVIEESVRSGVVSRYQKKMIDTILDFERTSVASVMIPLEKVAKVEITATVGEVKTAARQTGSRMILVYEEDPSIVVGMIYVYDLLFETQDGLELRNFLRSPIFLPQSSSVENAFLTLQAKRQSYAVVMSSEGDVIGTVPIERLLTYNSI
jgi:CBS domain containing-hemolysin-like protein